jgi:hypothetical protein
LERVDGDLSIDGNPGLDVLGLTRLAHVRSLAVTGSAAVTDLDLLALSDVTLGLDIRGNAALRHIQLPVLRRADLGVFDNPQLPACEVAAVFAAIAGEHHQSGNDEIAVCGPGLRAAREGAR